jgi:nicotinamidase-related amidase
MPKSPVLRGVEKLYVSGVFAEGCVRSTLVDAIERGYVVNVIADAVASNASWKRRVAPWSMRRSGADFVREPLPSSSQAPASSQINL